MNFLGLTIHLYGLIAGTALILGLLLIEYRLKKLKSDKDLVWLNQDKFWQGSFYILLFGVVGARLWHVATDFYLYQGHLLNAFKIWQGGLSILGGIAGGILGLWWWLFFLVEKKDKSKVKKNFWIFLDLVVFGLPFGQALGRLGNFVNQELYGLPTELPWAIKIAPEFRLPGYENFEMYHPLFAYEALLMLVFVVGIWWLSLTNKNLKWFPSEFFKIGTGNYFLLYGFYYATVRFLLDFLRIEKTLLGSLASMEIGINQFLVLVASLFFGFWLIRNYLKFNSGLKK